MVTSVHLVTGAAIGVATGNVYVASVFAFGAHYLLDAIPHWSWKPVKNYKEGGWRKANKIDLMIKSFEPILGILFTTYFVYHAPSYLVMPMIFGAFFGWMPDLLVFLKWKFGIPSPKPLQVFEEKFHKHVDSFWGIVWQVIFFLGILYYLYSILL